MCGDQKIIIGDGHRRWADAVDAVLATDSEAIVAVDKQGSSLRVCQRGDIDDAPSPEEEAAVTDKQKEFAQVAQIIADAYSVAHEHARENSARGYELLAKMTEATYARLASIEKAYVQLLMAQARMLESGPQNDGLDGAIGELVGRAMAGGGNGKGKVEPKPDPKPEPEKQP